MISNYLQNLLESAIIISLFCVLYILIFQKGNSFKQNRFFLLVGILFSITTPFIEFSYPQQLNILPMVELKTITILPDAMANTQSPNLPNAISILFGIYLFGISVFVIRFVHQLVSILMFFKTSTIVTRNDVKIILTGRKHSAFSFLEYVFIDKTTEKSKDLDLIIKHEIAHISQKHSIDLLLFELLLIVQWFNPLVWIYGKKIKENHEFLADKALLDTGIETEHYQQVLLNAQTFFNYDLINNFNHSLTFKRLIMMTKREAKAKAIIKLIAVIPVLFISVYFISCSKDSEQNDKITEATEEVVVTGYGKTVAKSNTADKVQETSIIRKDKNEQIFAVVEKMPVYEGGDLGLRKYIATNVKYPTSAIDNGIEGKVYIKFVVNAQGAVEQAEVVRGIDPILDKEALRVVSYMPAKWSPGEQGGKKVPVYYTVPINFRLQ